MFRSMIHLELVVIAHVQFGSGLLVYRGRPVTPAEFVGRLLWGHPVCPVDPCALCLSPGTTPSPLLGNRGSLTVGGGSLLVTAAQLPAFVSRGSCHRATDWRLQHEFVLP